MTARHVIHTLQYDLTATDRRTAERAQRVLSELTSDVIRELDRVFAHLPDGTVRRFDKIEIDLGTLTLRELPDGFAPRMGRSVQAALDRGRPWRPRSSEVLTFPAHPHPAARVVTAEPSVGTPSGAAPELVDAVLFFLNNGFFPWWFPRARAPEMMALDPAHLAPDSRDRLRTGLVELLVTSPSALLRLIRQISRFDWRALLSSTERAALEPWLAAVEEPALAQHLLGLSFMATRALERQRTRHDVRDLLGPSMRALLEDHREGLDSFVARMRDFPACPLAFRAVLEAFDHAASREGGVRSTKQAPGDMLAPTSPRTRGVASLVASTPSLQEAEAGLFVQNAGIVLLHPFLRGLFGHMGWLDGHGNLEISYRWHAVQALHVLASGTGTSNEHELLLEKVLCGIDLNEVAETPLLGSDFDIEAHGLLSAAVGHWKALRDTSPGGLREGFLQRDGVLHARADRWVLCVERRSYDLLLDRLPWSLSVVLLHWMREPLHVEWPRSG